MLHLADGTVVSPTDLVDLLECGHRSALRHALAVGLPGAPEPSDTPDPLVVQHGLEHERAVLEGFRRVFGPEGVLVVEQPAPTRQALLAAAATTRAALERGVPVVHQGVLLDAAGAGLLAGRADFLVNTAFDPRTGARRPGAPARYEPWDTKLARTARPAAVVQLTAYAQALAATTGAVVEHMHLLLGDGTREQLRVADFTAVVTDLRHRLQERIAAGAVLPDRAWGEERPACTGCAFESACEQGREADRDLSLVAGLRSDQRRVLVAAGFGTIDALAAADPGARPTEMSQGTWTSLRLQAALQVRQDATRTPEEPTGQVVAEVVDPAALAALPDPDPGDVFFDMEGDPYALHGAGLEYLFGAVVLEGGWPGADELPLPGPAERFVAFWAHNRGEEKRAFEEFVDFAVARRAAHPGAHVYHYAPYETTALKRLAAQHGTREDEVAELLRTRAFVDLYAVVRKGLRVSQRSYSIKYLEPLYMPAARSGEVKTAAGSIEVYERFVTARGRGDDTAAKAALDDIAAYNEDDCVSTHRLFRWLHRLREEHGIAGAPPVEPDAEELAAMEERRLAREEQAAALAAITGPLLAGLPDDEDGWDADARARAVLAAAAGYHRREMDPVWWDYFRRVEQPLSDLETDATCAVPVSWRAEPWQEPAGRVRNHKRVLRARCNPERPHPFAPDQSVRLLYADGGATRTRGATVVSVSGADLELLESVKPDAFDGAAALPVAVLPGDPVKPRPKDAAVEDLARRAADALPRLPRTCGVDLLRRTPPRLVGGGALPGAAEHGGDLVRAVIAAVDALDSSTLAVQGPPGAGKTYLAGELVRHLVDRGRTVGVTSTSHRAVENVLAAAAEAGQRAGTEVPAAKKPQGKPLDDVPWEQPKDLKALVRFRAEHPGGHLVGGTAWNFSAAELRADPVDVLIVDEAGQFALADALAVSGAARNLVLLGDPQQLPQVVQGTHPHGADASALGHLIGDADTVPAELGYFLDVSRRMHPAVCAPVSQLSYAGLLHSHGSAAARSVDGVEPGLHVLRVEHSGRTTSSVEEAAAVVDVVAGLVGRTWRDGSRSRALTAADVLVVAPYNVQVRLVQQQLAAAGLGEARVGTVDRFQGQEAPVVVATMTSSSAGDLPRGLEFLLSRNRLNVALSRAQAVAVLVCSPQLAAADVRSVQALRLLSGLLGLLQQGRAWG
ncbi:TM0106 family RecB-like putative nuclease [Kineococcus glutinatus]|uniref:TM0106 family RecB-like putative nuclease n=1 Tax=Kineococcus glutinatus TaxID=1070872 RepID=A0ABP9I9L8_9ACTN